jgi:LmbE family N-acetylglucosaminyl deacetylase
MAVLGVDEHRIIGLPDGGLQDDDESMIERMVSLVDEIRPDTILTFGPDGMTFHPDHVAVHHWVTEAWHRTGASARLLYATTSAEFLRRYRELFEEWGMYMTDDRPVGVPEAAVDVHLHLDGAELDRKLTALRAMATQTGGLIAAVGDEMYATQVAQEWFVDARTLMAAAGRQAVAVSSSSSPR